MLLAKQASLRDGACRQRLTEGSLVRMNPIGDPAGDGELIGLLTSAERSVLASIGEVVAYAPADRIIEEAAAASGRT